VEDVFGGQRLATRKLQRLHVRARPSPAATYRRPAGASITVPGGAFNPTGAATGSARQIRTRSTHRGRVSATGHGLNARTCASISVAGRDQSMRASSLRSFAAYVTPSVGWGRGVMRCCVQASTASTIALAPSVASRRAARPRFARADFGLPSKQLGTGVEARVHQQIVMPVRASPASTERWIGAAPRHRGSSEAWNVEAAVPRHVEHDLRQDQAVRDDHHHIGANAASVCRESGVLRLAGCSTRNPVRARAA
jgi:hypothetical protein